MLRKKIAAAMLVLTPVLMTVGCSESKPSEAEVKTALVSVIKKEGGSAISDEVAAKIADCAAPKYHDQLSATTLNGLIDEAKTGDGEADDSDEAAAKSILTECAKTAVGG